MTNHHARTRFRSACLGATALTGFTLLALPAAAIVIADPGTPTTARDPVNVTGVGQIIGDPQNGFIELCTGTLINPRTVIFAAHCVNTRTADAYGSVNGGTPIGIGFSNSNNTAGASAFGAWLNGVGGVKYQTNTSLSMFNINQVTYNPQSLEPAAAGFLYGDVALGTLDTAAVGIPTWSLLFSALPAPTITAAGTGYHVAIAGYGNNGTGITGSTGGIDFRRRTAANMLGALASLDHFENFLFGGTATANPMNLYWIDFDDPRRGTIAASPFDFNAWRDNAVPNEGLTAAADSGAPLILDETFSKDVVIGVNAGGYTRFFNGQPANGYGTVTFFQPLYLYWDWIAENNPYHYVSAAAGDGDWTDPAHWVSLLDPNYQIISGGDLVNGVPGTAGDGKLGSSGQFGQACFQSVGNSDCLDMATNVEAVEAKPIGTSGTAVGPIGQSLITKFEDASPQIGAVSAATLENGLAGATNFTPTNNNGSSSVAAQYFDVTLSAAGTTTLSGATISIDRLTLDGADAKLVIANSGNLSTMIDTSIIAGIMQVDGTYASAGAVTLGEGVLSGSGTVTAPAFGSLMGIIAPGTLATAGTLTLNGDVTLSGLAGVLVNMAPSAQDRLQINGAASINGFLGINFASGVYNYNYLTPYTLISSTGTLSGTFSDLMLFNLLGATAAISYDAHNVFLTLTPTVFRWSATPGSGDWNTGGVGGNWQYGLVPGANDIAIFGATTISTVSITQASVAKSLEFEAAAPVYTFAITGSAGGAASLTLSNGIANASSNSPAFTVSGVSGNAGMLAFTGTGNAANATITAGNFGSVTFSGNTNAGSAAVLVAQSGGTIDFSGTTGAVGDNRVSAGSIAGAGNFNLGANALTVGALNSSTEVSGVISGAGGALIKTGTGTLMLTGANTYGGGTGISGGTLQIGNGGTTGAILGNVANNGTLRFNRSDNISFGGVISGTGALTKVGGGSLTLTGVNTYNGATTVSAGILTVNGTIASSAVSVQSGAQLAGTGTVGATTIASGATLAPGTNGTIGTLTINGNLTLASGSALRIDTAGTTADRLTISGILNAGGTLTASSVNGYVAHYGDSVVIATANSVAGSFAAVTDNIAGVLKPTVSLTASQAILNIGADSFLTQFTSTSADQLLIAALLDNARPLNTGGLTPLYDAIDSLTGPALAEVFESLVPDVQRALSLTSQVSAGNFIDMITGHLGGLGGGSQSGPPRPGFHVDGMGLGNALNSITSYSADMQPFVEMGTRLASGPGSSLANLSGTPNNAQGGADSWITLPGGMGGFVTGRSLSGNVTVGGGGGKGRVRGYMIGAGLDFVLGDHLTIGAAAAMGETDTTLRPVSGTIKSDFAQGAIYARYDADNAMFVSAFAAVGSENIKTRRSVVVGATTYALTGKTDGGAPAFGLTIGRNYDLTMEGGSPLTLIPSLGIEYHESGYDAFTESGGVPAMTFADFSERGTTSRLGLDAKKSMTLGGVRFTPTAHVAWLYQLGGGNGVVLAGFAAVPTVVTGFANAKRTKSYGEVGIGTDMEMGDVLGTQGVLSVRYNATFGRRDLSYSSWMGQVKLNF